MAKINCTICGEEFDEEKEDLVFVGSDPDYEFFAEEGKEGLVCSSCRDNLSMYGSSLVIYQGGEERKFVFNDGLVNSIDEFDELDDNVEKCVRSIVNSERWVRTDGWRGYVDVSGGDHCVEIEGFNVLSGHHSEEMRASEDKMIREAFIELDIPLFRVVSRTTNLFASNASYFIPKENEDVYKKVIDFIKSWFNTDDFRWNIGIIFSDLQGSRPTKQIVEEMKKKGEIVGINWEAVAYPEKFETH